MVSRVKGTVGHAKVMKLAESRRRVSVIKLPDQHLDKKIRSLRTGPSSLDCSRDLDKHVINDGVEGGGGRFVIVDSTTDSSVEGVFTPGDPHRGF